MLGEYSSAWLLHFVLWGYFVLEVLANTSDVCHTKVCIKEAKRVMNKIDPSVNPCDDFYHFACGNYLKTEKLPKNKNVMSSFITVDNILHAQLDSLLISTPKQIRELKSFKMAKDFYKSCLRRDLIEKRGVGFLLDMIKSAGGWPLLEGEEWDADKFDWKETVYKLHDLGLGGEIFDISIGVDIVDSFKRVIEVDQVAFGLNVEYLIKGQGNEEVQVYRKYIANVAHLLGAKNVAVKDVNDTLNFEIELAKIALSSEERRDISKLYNPMPIKKLQTKYPIVDWAHHIMKLTHNITKLRTDEVISVKVPTYLAKLPLLLKETDNRTLANYLIWRGISGAVGILTSAMAESQLTYEEAIVGTVDREPRWKECLGITIGSMYLAVGSMYIRTFFTPEARENAVEMVENIRLEMLNVLKSVDFMDEVTRSRAIDKAKAMQKHVAYPVELLDNYKLNLFYEKLNISEQPYFDSIISLRKFFWNQGVSMLRQTINKTDWRSHGYAAIINAYFNHMENSVHLPAGILQDVFFSNDRPKYMNYGAIGFVVAHEITRGFDYMGQQFDKVGNLAIWWKEETREEFTKKVQCFINQANNYTVKSVKKNINGLKTQGQNVADTGGIKLSYKAYNAWAEKNQKEPRLLGLEKYTPQQMFWLSAAHVWCTVYQEDLLKAQMDGGSHPPAEYRVNGAMRNQETFAKDFNCPVGSFMNPAEKCNLW